MLLLLKIESLLRSELHSLCIAFCSLVIVLGVEPVVPAEVSPCEVHLRIHLHTPAPLLCSRILLLVVEETAEIVIWLVTLREEFLRLFKHRNGLKTERIAIIHRHCKSSLIHGLV